MTDAQIKALSGAGLGLQLAALAAGFTPAGWRWPLIAATVVVAVGVFLVAGVKPGRIDVLNLFVVMFTLASLGAAAWHALSPSAAAAWALRILFGVQVLLMGAWFAFIMTFRLTRLW